MVLRLCLAARAARPWLSLAALLASVPAEAALDLQLKQQLRRASITRDFSNPSSVVIEASETRSASQIQHELRALQIDSQIVGEQVFARVSLSVLAEHSSAFDFRAATPLRPLLDRSLVEVHATEVHRGVGVRPRTGKGVLVGILDTGIDLHHQAFLGADGKSRIRAVWNQDVQGKGPAGYGFGKVCEQKDIAAGQCDLVDRVGHGTHVAGIVAGAMAPHLGLAPDAELVIVQSSQFTDVAAAVDWMFRIAAQEGKPMVVNLSLGGHLGAHDGQSDLEKALDRLQGPGRVIVTAAGNDGSSHLHARLPAARGEMRTEIEMPPAGLSLEVYADMWQNRRSLNSYALEVTDRSGRLLTRYALDDFTGAGQDDTLLVDGVSHGRFSFATEIVKGNNKRHHLLIVDRSRVDSDYTDERWFLVARGDDLTDVWLTGSDYSFANPTFGKTNDLNLEGFVAGDTNSTLTIPGTAANVITVGSYVTKNEWANQKGKTFQLSSTEIHSLSGFSSAGPTANPELTGNKPDLVAPGQLIAGPRAHDASTISSTLAIDENFAIMQGTSMSAPHVSGAVALMMEARPELTPQEAKDILTSTARNAFSSVVGQGKAGAGALDVQSALQKLEGIKPRGCQSAAPSSAFWLAMILALALRRRRQP